MKKTVCSIMFLLALAVSLSACGQAEESASKESQLYAACDNYFNIGQTQEWAELGAILHGIQKLEENAPDELRYVLGRVDSMSVQVPAYQALKLSVPNEVLDQMLPDETAKAYELYCTARMAFLEAIQANADSPKLTDPSSDFRTAIPTVLEGFETINYNIVRQRPTKEQWMNYSKNLYDISARMQDAAARLISS